MEKKTFSTVTRVMAVVAALLIIVGAASMLPESQMQTKRGAGDFYTQTSGLDSDAVVMTVDGRDVTAQEYLYYVLNYGYQYYSYYAMAGASVDWNMAVDGAGTVTLAEMIRAQAQESVVQDCVLCNTAETNGISVTQEDMDAFRANIDSMKEMYGEDLSGVLMSYGLTEKLWGMRNDVSCLSAGLQEAYLTGALRPDAAALQALVSEHGLTMARSVLVSTANLDDEGIEQAKTAAEEYRTRIAEAEDMVAELVAVNTELGVSDEENVAGLYHCGHDHGAGEEDPICETLEALELGELSRVVEAEDGFYLLLREEIDTDTAVQLKFGEDLETAMANAKVVYNEENMDRLDVGQFIENFMAALAAAAPQSVG